MCKEKPRDSPGAQTPNTETLGCAAAPYTPYDAQAASHHQVLRARAQVMLSLSHPLVQDTVVKLSSSRAAASMLTEFHKATPGSLHTANF